MKLIFKAFKDFFNDCNWWQKILFVLLIPILFIVIWLSGYTDEGQD